MNFNQLDRPLSSRFQEHFDYQLAPPAELLSDSSSKGIESNLEKKKKRKSTPLFALNTTAPITRIDPLIPLSSQVPTASKSTPANKPIKLSHSKSQPVIQAHPLPSQSMTNVVSTRQKKHRRHTSLAAEPVPPLPALSSDLTSPTTSTNIATAPLTDYVPIMRRAITSNQTRNRAEIIIKRYESWSKFIAALSSWISGLIKQSTQSERTFEQLKLFPSNSTNTGNLSINQIHQALSDFTTDLATQEREYVQQLKGFLPVLESYRKDCLTTIKQLKNRNDLNMEELVKRAGLTGSLISQLKRTCHEAHLAFKKGMPIANDPWLANLHVLRQLKKETDEENRLRSLMIPIQQAISDFEQRLLKSVEQAIKLCFEKYSALLTQDKLTSLQSALDHAVTDNWTSFVQKNKQQLVDEQNPTKHYLHINYACKQDPFVLTLFKGEIERRSSVLGKYTPWFFVLTESGFLYQFKLNDKISPESSIYIPKSTIVPCFDINRPISELEQCNQPYSFEIQRCGSVLHRDKSSVFRTSHLDDIVTWCRLLNQVANRSPDTIVRQETTPPPSPLTPLKISNDIIPLSTPEESPVSFKQFPLDQTTLNHKQYAPQLNLG
ncbi:Phosphatidylinositol 4,5-bisphosphate-binding protein SLM2 [Choanephora cucurbitarum]|uniref:Phosphatidylinositol 4,5-bisphosphate-binding protein SLM2 n=1 Tax=Choanephora cucurbitarum TaxID=101091 RepID=A0A1C7MX85_9FUNG|nr:Phosphatidylinositol 4,5-bisphosphate-binding protein SLM2 [Choanephora cucurbitarum]